MGKSREIARLPNVPAFSAHRSSSNQSITTATWTKVQFQTEEFDTASAYDNATNFRFTPQVAGYYQVNGTLYFTATGLTNVGVQVYKNGTAAKIGTTVQIPSSSEGGASVAALIYMNGTTDFLELFGFAAGTSPAVLAGANTSFFQAALVRMA